jgi:hypothetical protein
VQSLPVIEAAAPPPPGPTAAAPAATNPPPAATNPPAGPTNTAPPPAASNGLVVNYFRIRNPTAAVNQEVWFEFEVLNPTNRDVAFNLLAAHTDVGYTAKSWGPDTFTPNRTLTWEDHIEFDKAGTYQVYLGICYASRETCLNPASRWDRLSNSITVTIQ